MSRPYRMSFVYYQRPSLLQMRFFSLEPLILDLTSTNNQKMASNKANSLLFPPCGSSSSQIDFRQLIQQVRRLPWLYSDVLRLIPAQCLSCYSRRPLNNSPKRNSLPTFSGALQSNPGFLPHSHYYKLCSFITLRSSYRCL
jgi:hypothetical protein